MHLGRRILLLQTSSTHRCLLPLLLLPQSPLLQVIHLTLLRTPLRSRYSLPLPRRNRPSAMSAMPFVTVMRSPNDAYEKMVVENVLDISFARISWCLHRTPLRV